MRDRTRWNALSLGLASLLLAAGAEDIGPQLQAVRNALDPEKTIDLDQTLDAIETLREAKPVAESRKQVVELLIRLIERKAPITLQEGSPRVPPLMLIKSEAVRTLHELGASEALPALKAFQASERNERFFPAEVVEKAVADLSAAALEASRPRDTDTAPEPGAWRERWNQTEEGRQFLQLADRMARGTHGEASQARDALIRSGNPVVPFLTDCLLRHEHHVGRRSSAYLLGQINDPGTVPDLIEALKEPNDNVLWTIITSLGFMEDQRATEKIIPFLDHPLDRIRLAAGQALVRLRDPKSVDILMAHIAKYPKGRSRAKAAEALGEIGDRRAMPLLLQTMTDRHLVPREYAAMSYGRLANETELEALLDRAKSGEVALREIQLAFEEHFQVDFPLSDKGPREEQVEQIRAQYKRLKEGKPLQLHPSGRPPADETLDDGGTE